MNVLTKDFLLLSDFCDRYGRWKPSQMLVAMQELAGEHSERLDVGREKVLESGAIWVLTRTELHVQRYPVFLDHIVGRTFPTTVRRTLYPRFFVFEDAQGHLLASGSTYWAVMDLETQRMVSHAWINERIPNNNEAIARPLGYPGSAKLAAGEEELSRYQPVYADLDLNGHVNNTKSADWACNLLGSQTLARQPIKTMVLNYNREIRGSEPVDFSFRRAGSDFSLRCLREGVAHIDVSGTLMDSDDQGGKPSPVAALEGAAEA
ncbi:MAG: hypothetical protein GX810_05805 [Clostridiales bacterium]|nr:hypothetical protein [Clostridiales bacterium]